MKPRNRHEKHIADLQRKLPSMTAAQRDYALKHCLPHNAVRRNGMMHCMDCGATWKPDTGRGTLDERINKHRCPECGTELELLDTRKRKWEGETSMLVITTAGESQVFRTFRILAKYEVGKRREVWMPELSDLYLTPGERDVLFRRTASGFLYRRYDYFAPMTIKQAEAYTDLKWYAASKVVYPRQRILPVLLRNGYRPCQSVMTNPYMLMNGLLYDRHIETIVKAGRMDIYDGLGSLEIRQYWQQVKMIVRHGYHPSSVSMWRDTLRKAAQCGLDNTGAAVVMPEDLNAMHDRINRRHTRMLEREELQRRREHEREWLAERERLMGVEYTDGGLRFVPLRTEDDFKAEGKAMHHCVASYWLSDDDGFCLSVRDMQDNRVATVELDMDTFEVVQCRAYKNEKPERYDDIIDIIGMHRKEYLRAKKLNKYGKQRNS